MPCGTSAGTQRVEAVKMPTRTRRTVQRSVRRAATQARGARSTPGSTDDSSPPISSGALPVDGDAQRSGPRRRFTTRIELAVIRGEIQELGVLEKAVTSTGDPVDAIAVGHYLGVRPVEAELALDRALSAALPSPPHGRDDVTNDDLILTQFTDRGVIRGDLGQVFFLHDARSAASGGEGRSVERVIAIAGMGVPAQFGEPELTVLARELCWSVGRLGKRHLATVVIGNGRGNLHIGAGISGWVRGVKRAGEGGGDERRR